MSFACWTFVKYTNNLCTERSFSSKVNAADVFKYLKCCNARQDGSRIIYYFFNHLSLYKQMYIIMCSSTVILSYAIILPEQMVRIWSDLFVWRHSIQILDFPHICFVPIKLSGKAVRVISIHYASRHTYFKCSCDQRWIFSWKIP